MRYKTFPKCGHPQSPENTALAAGKYPYCRRCHNKSVTKAVRGRRAVSKPTPTVKPTTKRAYKRVTFPALMPTQTTGFASRLRNLAKDIDGLIADFGG